MNAFRKVSVPLVAACLVVSAVPSALCQASKLVATHQDVAYHDADPAQKLDVYLAESEEPVPAMIYIHGGAWQAGSKSRIPGWLARAVQDELLTVVSVEYRFSSVAPHPAQVNDCVRAVQFVRHHAAKWNIDPARIGITGGSAGGHLSLWVALHDDAAAPDSSDPVERESSRVACAVSFAGPTDWSLLSVLEHRHPAYRLLLGYQADTPVDKLDAEAKADVSPISFASQDDPPVLQVHGERDEIVPLEHARNMDDRLKSLGVKSELVVIEGAGHGVSGAGPEFSRHADGFLREQLLRP